MLLCQDATQNATQRSWAARAARAARLRKEPYGSLPLVFLFLFPFRAAGKQKAFVYMNSDL